MSATNWSLYNKAKKKIGNATINLASNNFFIQLHTSASIASTFTLSTAASVGNEVANGNGYTTGAKALTGSCWSTGRSAKEYRFDANDPVWTGTGGTIPNIKFAVLKNSAGHAIAWSRLTTAQFTLAQNNTLTLVLDT